MSKHSTDEILDKILPNFSTWCLCGADECTKYQNYKNDRQAISDHYARLEAEQAECNRARAEQSKKDIEIMKTYWQKAWMCEVLHGGYNADDNDVYKSLKEYEKREDFRQDFAQFFEKANAELQQLMKGEK